MPENKKGNEVRLIAHYYLRILCFQYKVVSVEYFMQMQGWEVIDYMDNLEYADANNWEQTRLVSYIIGNLFNKNPKKINEWMTFPWEKTDAQIKAEAIAELPKEISNEDVATFNNAMGFGAMAMNKGKRRLKNGDTQH